jgi:tetratricopeptide (TPR) repeat protein
MATGPFQAELARAIEHMRAGRAQDAEAILSDIVARDRTHLQANHALAALAEGRGLPGAAIGHLQVVVEAQPDNLDARLRLAANLRKLGRDEEALAHYEQASRLDPQLPGPYNNMGNICRELRREGEAERYLRKALDLQPDMAQAHNNLGALFSEQGRVDEAIEEFRAAIAAKPDYVSAYRNLATTRRHTARDDTVRAMERLFDQPGASEFDRMHLGFGLGKACEELEKYDRAFDYWAEANRCQRVLRPYDIDPAIVEMRAMRSTFDADRLREARGASSGQTPVFVVGMPRSGTSLTEQILASHSSVFGAGELDLVGRLLREAAPDYPRQLTRLTSDAYRALGSRYLRHIADASGDARWVVDKLPENFLYVGAIRMMLADAVVIHCRRDPLDTGPSCFKNHFLGSRLDFSCDLGDLGVYYRHYEALMGHWRDVLPGFVHDSGYEALVAAPEPRIRALLDHCGLPFEEACLASHNTTRMVATASAVQVRQPVHSGSVGAWRRFADALEPLREALDRPASL